MYKTYTGIILKRQAFREADEVLTFWSWEEGKVRLRVKAVRKPESRLKAATAALSWLRLSVVSSEYLPVVVSATVTNTYRRLSHNLSVLAAVFNLFEMVLRTTADKQPNPGISMILRRHLDYLEDGNPTDEDYFSAFRLNLLSALGYHLSLEHCVNCNKNLDAVKNSFFSNSAFGVLCGKCVTFSSDAEKLDAGVREHLMVLNKDFLKQKIFQPDLNAKAPAARLLSDFFHFVTERPLNSQKFLDQTLVAELD